MPELIELGYKVDTAPLYDATDRLDKMGESSQRAAGHLLMVGNQFRAMAADMSKGSLGAENFDKLLGQSDAARRQLDLMSGAAANANSSMTDGFSKSHEAVSKLFSTLQVVPDSLKAIETGVDRTFIGIAKGVDLVARGITDLRTIRSVFERDIDQPAQTTGQHLAETAKHAIELKLATQGFSAAGMDSAASLVTIASRASLATGAVLTLGSALYEASVKAKAFENEGKALTSALQFTNNASGISTSSAQSLIDTANRNTGFDRSQLDAAMESLIKARSLGPADIASTFNLGTTWADRSGQDAVKVVETLIGAYNDLGSAAKNLEAIGINLDASERKQVDAFAASGEKAKGLGVIMGEVSARNAEYASKIDDSTASSRRFSAEFGELERNIGQGWRDLLSYFEVDVSKYLVDPVRDALSEIINMVNSTVHATSANLETRLALAQKGLSAAEGLASGDTVQEGIDYTADVIVRRKEVEQLTAALKAAKEAEKSLQGVQGEKRQKAVEDYEKSKADASKGGGQDDAIAAILRQTEVLQHQAEAWKQGADAAQAAQIADEAYDQVVKGATANERAYADALAARAAAQAEAAGQKQLYLEKQDNADYLELLDQVRSGEMKLIDLEDELDNKRHERSLEAQGIQGDMLGKLMDEYQIRKDLIDQYDTMNVAADNQKKAWDEVGKALDNSIERSLKAATDFGDEYADALGNAIMEALS